MGNKKNKNCNVVGGGMYNNMAVHTACGEHKNAYESWHNEVTGGIKGEAQFLFCIFICNTKCSEIVCLALKTQNSFERSRLDVRSNLWMFIPAQSDSDPSQAKQPFGAS